MKKSQLEKLKKGYPPNIVNWKWDNETVIVGLASALLDLPLEQLIEMFGKEFDDIIGEGEWKCYRCHKVKPIGEFYKKPKSYSPICKKCKKEENREYYEKNKGYWKKRYKNETLPERLKKEWDITVSEYKSIYDNQGGKCFECGEGVDIIDRGKRLVEIDNQLRIYCRRCYLEYSQDFGTALSSSIDK